MSAGYRYRKRACSKPLAFSRPRAKTKAGHALPGADRRALADRLLLPAPGVQRKTRNGAACVLDEFELIPGQQLSPIAAADEIRLRLGRERLYVATRAKMQDQRFAIDSDYGLAPRRDLVSPRVLGEGRRREPEP